MNPWLLAASYAGGKIASALTPSHGWAAHQATEDAASQLGNYRDKYDQLYNRGQGTLDTYSPQLDSAVGDYSSYLKGDPSSGPQNAYDLAQNTEALRLDAQQAAARLARGLGTDSASSGALAGGLTSIEDRRLSGEAAARAKIAEQNILERERRRKAQISLMAEQVARGEAAMGAGLAGGVGIGGNLLALRSGQESIANAQDGASMQGWQSLASDLAKSYAAKGK